MLIFARCGSASNFVGGCARMRHRGTPVAVVTGDCLDDTVAIELHQLGASVACKPLLGAELVALTRRLLAGRAAIQ